ncbi:MAG: TolC family protein [Rhodospirillales bacterium]|nr:TolC family protein [Alphaproteobacteria bacterium]USO06552.1 MAG: TolC family protein [Rhodospirillales bacterium]
MMSTFNQHIKRTIALACIVAVFTVASQQSLAQEVQQPTSEGFPISLNSMVLFALYENPDINLLKAREEQTYYSIKEKEASYYPEVVLDVDGGREFNDPATGGTPGSSGTNNTGGIKLSLSQLVFNGFKTSHEIRNRENLNKASQFRTQATIEEVINETVENYLKALRFQKDITVIEQLLIDVNRHVSTIEEMFEAGAAGKVMLEYATSRQAFATTELNRAHSSLNDAISNLEFLVGKLPPDFLAISPEELRPSKLDMQYYLKAIEENNNQVLAGLTEIAAMKETLKAEKGKYMPEVRFNLLADQSHNDGGRIGRQTELSAKFRLNYKLFDGGKRDAAVKRIRGQVSELNYKKEQIVKELKKEVKLAYNQVDANKTALALTDIEISSNIGQTRLNEENFKLGNINVIELIESNERLKDAYLKKNKLNYEMHLNAYSLLVLTNILQKEYFCETC